MKRARLVPAVLAIVTTVATSCGGDGPAEIDGRPPSPADAARPDAGRPDARPTEFPATITGQVWAPGQAPGMVPAGHEIPVAEAAIYLSIGQLPPIDEAAHCEPCEDDGAVKTDLKGNFTLEWVNPGTYWLTIKKGLFRLDQQVTVGEAELLTLTAPQTTLPSLHDPAAGKWTPRIAIADGLAGGDNIEDVIGKMGIGSVDATGTFVGASAAGVFDLYSNGGGEYDAYTIGTLNDLISDLPLMLTYHVIFIPCTFGDHSQLFANQSYRDNIRDYISMGGKLYTTDFSAEWEDVVFPEFIRFPSAYDTPAGATMESQFGSGDSGAPVWQANAKILDGKLHGWMDGQVGPLASGGFGAHDPDAFLVTALYNKIEELPLVHLGEDDKGNPVVEQGYPWVLGDWNDGAGMIHPFTTTFEPIGCGRVLYSAQETSNTPHQGLTPQERVLLFLIMEIGVCKAGPIID